MDTMKIFISIRGDANKRIPFLRKQCFTLHLVIGVVFVLIIWLLNLLQNLLQPGVELSNGETQTGINTSSLYLTEEGRHEVVPPCVTLSWQNR